MFLAGPTQRIKNCIFPGGVARTNKQDILCSKNAFSDVLTHIMFLVSFFQAWLKREASMSLRRSG